jgi:hypothetical protein
MVKWLGSQADNLFRGRAKHTAVVMSHTVPTAAAVLIAMVSELKNILQ